MAQPNLAREPSMEEILASIRRIIESNEPGGEGPAPRDFADYGDDIEIAEESDFSPEIAANDRGVPPRDVPQGRSMAMSPHLSAHQQAPAQAGGPATSPEAPATVSGVPALPERAVPERSLSLADVAARVRAASGRAAEAIEVPAPPRAAADTRSVVPAPRPAMPPIPELGQEMPPKAAEPQFARPAFEQFMSPPVSRNDAEPQEQMVEPAPEQPREEAVEAKPETLPAKIEAAASLMSLEAGEQVARSFGELADVLDGLGQKSLEDMAQEMMRPMLQEWLDDNLPTLVERLVREEIERVARGPRR